MSKENLISLNIPQADIDAIKDALQVLETKLLPHLVELTNDEKVELPKMKDKTMAFVLKATDHAEHNPKLAPAYMDVVELRKDLKAVELFRNFQIPLEKINKALDDSITIAGSEAYTSALSFYNTVKMGAKMNVSGAQEVYEDLKVRFENQGKKKPKQ
jgi:hypothetical protein